LFTTNAVCYECAFFLFWKIWIVLAIRGKQERSVKLRVDTWISGSLHTHTLLLLLCSATKGQAALPPICILFSLQFNLYKIELNLNSIQCFLS
jgi:hypothetical protein